jgi:large subunit ribosomal protein L10
MIKDYKIKIVHHILSIFQNMKLLIVLNIHGICAENMRSLRATLNKADIKIKVFKNKLTKYAIKNSIFNSLSPDIKGQVAFLWDNKESLMITKLLNNFNKEVINLNVLCGFLNGKKISVDYIKYLSTIPDLATLRLKLLLILSIIAKQVICKISYQLLMIINIIKQKI